VVDEAALITAPEGKENPPAGLAVFAQEPESAAGMITWRMSCLLPACRIGIRWRRARAMDTPGLQQHISWFSGKGRLTSGCETPGEK